MYESLLDSTGTIVYPTEFIDLLPYSFYFGGCCVWDNKIHILGGGADEDRLNHYAWDGSSWHSISALPHKCYGAFFDTVCYNNQIHLLGGLNSSSTDENTLRHYAWDGISWTSVSTLPHSYESCCAVVYDGKIHMLGGYATSYKKAHYAWDGISWTSVSTLPYDFLYGSAVVYNGKIHIFGQGSGSTSSKYGKYHYSWDGEQWTQEDINSMPQKCYGGGGIVSYENKIYFMSEATQDRYQIWNGESYQINSLPYLSGASSGLVVFNNKIHVLGSNRVNIGTNHYYLDDPENNTWTNEFESAKFFIMNRKNPI